MAGDDLARNLGSDKSPRRFRRRGDSNFFNFKPRNMDEQRPDPDKNSVDVSFPNNKADLSQMERQEHALPGDNLVREEKSPSGNWKVNIDSTKQNSRNGSQSNGSWRSKFMGWLAKNKGSAAAGGSLATIVATAGVMTIMVVPNQLLHIAGMLNDTFDMVRSVQTNFRTTRNASVAARASRAAGSAIEQWTNASGRFAQESRVGVLQSEMGNRTFRQLEAAGFTQNVSSRGKHLGWTIDVNKLFAAAGVNPDILNNSNRRAYLSRILDVPESAISLSTNSNDRVVFDLDTLGTTTTWSNGKDRILRRMYSRATGRGVIASWIMTRPAATMMGIRGVFHPFATIADRVTQTVEEAKKTVIEKVKDAISGRTGDLNLDIGPEPRRNDYPEGVGGDRLYQTDLDTYNNKKTLASNRASVAEEISRSYVEANPPEGGPRARTKIAKAAGIIGLVVGGACIAKSMTDTNNSKQNSLTSAIGLRNAISATAGQQQAGELSGEDLGNYTSLMFGSTEVNDDGSVARYHSFMDGSLMRVLLGDSTSVGAETPVVQFIMNLTSYGIEDLVQGFFSIPVLGDLITASCDIVATPLASWILNVAGAFDLTTYVALGLNCVPNIFDSEGAEISWGIENGQVCQGGLVDSFFSWATGAITGQLLDIPGYVDQGQVEYLSDAAVLGSVASNNETSRIMGANFVDRDQALRQNQERIAYLDAEYEQKPIMARLFDPTDYRSSLSTATRTLDFDTSEISFRSILANTAKMITVGPMTLARAINPNLGILPSASAATEGSAALINWFYDQGIKTSAWTDAEMAKMDDDVNYNMYENINRVGEILNSSAGTAIIEKLKKCHGVNIDPNTLNITAIRTEPNDVGVRSESARQATLFYDGGGDINNCSGTDDDNYFRVRLYILDYSTTMSQACFLYSGDDNTDQFATELRAACEYAGYSGGGSTLKTNPGTVSGEITELVQKILDAVDSGDAAADPGIRDQFAKLLTNGGKVNGGASGENTNSVNVNNSLLAFIVEAIQLAKQNGFVLKLNSLDTPNIHYVSGATSSHYRGEGIDLGNSPPCSGSSDPSSACYKLQQIIDEAGEPHGISCALDYERLDYNGSTHAHCSTTGN